QVGLSTDTSSTLLTSSGITIRNCTNDIMQEGTSTLNLNACTTSSSKIIINDSTNVAISYFDLENNNALTIGSFADEDTSLLQAAIANANRPSIDYKSSLYSTQAIGFENPQ